VFANIRSIDPVWNRYGGEEFLADPSPKRRHEVAAAPFSTASARSSRNWTGAHFPPGMEA